MSKNLNSFILTDDIIDIMKQKIKKTETIGREHGFNLCHTKGIKELKDDTHCIGTDCSISFEKTCKATTAKTVWKKVGDFHTHPSGNSEPSLSDLWNAYHYGIECIGGTKDKKITCYVRKDKERDPKISSMFSANSERFKSLGSGKKHHLTTERGYQIYMTKHRDLQYLRDILQKKYFDTVNIT
jgi:hypothetical protein